MYDVFVGLTYVHIRIFLEIKTAAVSAPRQLHKMYQYPHKPRSPPENVQNISS